ncbi:MAG: hypothetical protein KGD59_15235 [Candidatus Heimdallarchaeota archaeon]|nr:hypothetical protein [Candidatus Heimdallarchaeota archaeon]MBY8995901.1 hypothetical protein [Candidatus Heimdallarchaeota archaeon]
MTKEIFENIAILSAYIAQQIAEDEGIGNFCKTPCDLAVISHNKRYTNKDLFGKMLFHLAEYGYFERRGVVFVLADKWRRVLPAKATSRDYLREQGANQLFLFQEYLAKSFLEIIRNETEKIDLAKLVYFIDTIDGSRSLHSLRSEAISQLEFSGTPKKILDINYGFGYSAIQLASVFQESEVYSLQLNTALKEPFEYTIKRYEKGNLESSIIYPSEMLNNLIKEKVDLIFGFNPLGISTPNLDRVLNIASQVSKDGTKLLLYVPYKDEPRNTLISEWLGLCIDGINEYANFDTIRAALTKYNFELTKKSLNSRYIISYHSKTD